MGDTKQALRNEVSRMAFLDDLSRKLTQVGQEAASQTRVFAETTRINAKISDEERQLGALFAQLGRNFFEANKDNPNAAFADSINSIKDAMHRIDGYRAEIRRARGMVTCPQCGSEVSSSVQFCSYCGSKMPPPPEYFPGDMSGQAGFSGGLEGLGDTSMHGNGVYSSPNADGTTLNYNSNIPTYDITAMNNVENNTPAPLGSNTVSLEKKDEA